jgi:UDPglucose 6-dehydrogenase
MEDLKIGVTSDTRISTWGSYVSNGAGGSCFGKDIQSLIFQLKQADHDATLLQAVYDINEHQKEYLIDRAEHEANFNFNHKRVAVLGLAFKKRTNDMRDSAALKAITALLGRGVEEVRAYDPLANHDAQTHWLNPKKNYLYERISYFDSAEEAMAGCDAVYISTDWEEFRSLSQGIIDTVAPPCLIIDGRRMIPDYDHLVSLGYRYLSVGGVLLQPEEKSADALVNGTEPQTV